MSPPWSQPEYPATGSTPIAADYVTLVLMPMVIMVMPVLIPVVRYILLVVPVILYEVDGPTARVVLSTMLTPGPLVTRRYVEVDRRFGHVSGTPLDHYWLGINQLRCWRPANVYLSIESWVPNVDGHTDVGCKRRNTECEESRRYEDFLHDDNPPLRFGSL